MIRQTFVFLVPLILLAAYTSSAEAPTAAPATQTPTLVPPTKTQIACQPSQIQETGVAFGEMESDGELWALLFFKTAYTQTEQKIVWRITGEGGAFEARAQSEDRTVIEPVWQQYHESSTWERPNEKWVRGFNFPAPGCWRITVSYGETKGMIALKVLGSP